MAKKKSAAKPARTAKKTKPAGSVAKKAVTTKAAAAPRATASSSTHRVFGFTFDVGPSYDGDLIVEVPYPRGVDGEVVAVILQPARDAGGIPDDWTEQHAVQVLRFSREPRGTATVRIHRIDAGWIAQGWVGNLVLHVLVAMV